MTELKNAPFMISFANVVDQMYRLGWDERNAGNVSYILSNEEVDSYKKQFETNRIHKLQLSVDGMVGKYLLITGTGKYFRNVKDDVKANACIIKILDETTYEILWGLKDGETPTSELSTHLMAHQTRLSVDPTHKVIIHTHATHINLMSAVEELNEKEISKKIWKLNTENIIILPEGMGIIPWEIPGNKEIGIHTSEKLKTYRIVMWPLHGVVASGSTLDDTFGLIETIEKAAHMYITMKNLKQVNEINDKDLLELSKAFNVTPNQEFIK
jgi:rhamnulose-1-phosphate aldolase